MKVHVLSKMEFDGLMNQHGITDDNVRKFAGIMFISIVDTQNEKGPHFKEDHENVINLRFDDVEHDLESSPTQQFNTKAFDKDQAKKLFQFIKKNREVEQCIVHCMAGISRLGIDPV